MGHQIIRQPNGLYALWSSIVDSFILFDATPEDIIQNWNVNNEQHNCERVMGHDPLHADAFKGTPAENVVVTTGPRLMVWIHLDSWGNMIGIEGTVLPC